MRIGGARVDWSTAEIATLREQSGVTEVDVRSDQPVRVSADGRVVDLAGDGPAVVTGAGALRIAVVGGPGVQSFTA